MFTPISVSLSGPAFSFLLYENSKCRFQQEGFLLGEIVHKETKTITDNDQEQVNITKTIKINSIMPCPETHFFYNGVGKIDRDKIKQFLGNQFSKVVAWYKYQRTDCFKFTFRDKFIHSQLIDLFEIPPEQFSCCLLIIESSENGSTHMYSQAFMRNTNSVSERLPIHIPNLSEPNNTYKNSEPATETFSKILRDLKIDRKNSQGLVIINKIQNALQKHIDSVIEKLSESEKYMHELEEEIVKLEILKKLKVKNEPVMEELELSFESFPPSIDEELKKSPNSMQNSGTVLPESSPDGQFRNVTKRGVVRGRGGKRGGGRTPKEVHKYSKTDEKEITSCKN